MRTIFENCGHRVIATIRRWRSAAASKGLRVACVLALVLLAAATAAAQSTLHGAGAGTPPSGPSRFAIPAGPVPAALTITFNNLCWAWASPCDGGCSSPSPSNQTGWRYATTQEWAARPTPNDFLQNPGLPFNSGTNPPRCASAYFDPIYSHCDWFDAVGGFVTSVPEGDNWESWYVADLVGGFSCGAVVGGGTGTCAEHTVHGHVSTSPPGHFAHIAQEGIHHGQHGHSVNPATECLAAGHHVTVNGHILGLTPESSDGVIPSALTREPDFVAALNQNGLNAPAAPGTIIQLFGSARGLFLDLADLRPALGFTAPASGSPLYYTESLPEVQIGGVKAEVLFSGLAPGLKGVWQINVRIPDGVRSGRVLVTIAYEGEAATSIDLAVE